VSAIQRRARELVATATALGWEGPPFAVEELASLRGLKVSLDPGLKPDQDACVMPGIVLLNPHKSRVRRRYSVAHEVGHTMFPDYASALERAGRLWRRDGDDSEFERLCQVAGAEFLFPLESFVAAVGREGHGIGAALRLAEAFDASPEATVRRMVETDDTAAIGLFLRPTDPTSAEWVQVDRGAGHAPFTPLGVFSSWTNGACGEVRITRGTPPPKKGAADRAWKRVSLARGSLRIEHRDDESWAHAGLPGYWESEALTLPKLSDVPQEVLCMMRRSDESPS
jgi:hypothetical protein